MVSLDLGLIPCCLALDGGVNGLVITHFISVSINGFLSITFSTKSLATVHSIFLYQSGSFTLIHTQSALIAVIVFHQPIGFNGSCTYHHCVFLVFHSFFCST